MRSAAGIPTLKGGGGVKFKRAPPEAIKSHLLSARKGLSAGADYNREEITRAMEILHAEMATLTNALYEYDTLLDRAGDLLMISQPRMSGRYHLRWWFLRGKTQNGLNLREPTLVRFIQSIKDRAKFIYKPARSLHRNSHGAFAVNANETSACLEIIKDAIRGRKLILNDVIVLRRILNGLHLNAHSIRAGQHLQRIESLKEKVVRNLINAGYEVEPRLLPEEENQT